MRAIPECLTDVSCIDTIQISITFTLPLILCIFLEFEGLQFRSMLQRSSAAEAVCTSVEYTDEETDHSSVCSDALEFSCIFDI